MINEKNTYIYYNGELYHAGVKGMQWGKHLPGTDWWKQFPVRTENSRPILSSAKSSRQRPNSKVDKIAKKMENYRPVNKDFDEFNIPVSYRRVGDERPFRIRGPYWRKTAEKDRKNPFFQIKKHTVRAYRKIRDKAFSLLKKSIDKYVDKSFGKYLEYSYTPPKGSDLINHLQPYVEKESDEALTTYINAVSTGDIGDYINSFIQSSQMNIVNGCARFLDSVGLDDEVNNFLNKLNIKSKK